MVTIRNDDGSEWIALPIRPDILESLKRYRDHRVPVGDFLTSILENDLVRACKFADDYNRHCIFQIVSWCYNNLPSRAWGSTALVSAWLRGEE